MITPAMEHAIRDALHHSYEAFAAMNRIERIANGTTVDGPTLESAIHAVAATMLDSRVADEHIADVIARIQRHPEAPQPQG